MGCCKSVCGRKERNPPPAQRPAPPPAVDQNLGSQPPPPSPVITPYRPYAGAAAPAPAAPAAAAAAPPPAVVLAHASPLRIEPVTQSRVVYECNNPVGPISSSAPSHPSAGAMDRPAVMTGPSTFTYPTPETDADAGGIPSAHIEPYDVDVSMVDDPSSTPKKAKGRPRLGVYGQPRPPDQAPSKLRARSLPPRPPPRQPLPKQQYYRPRVGSPLPDLDERTPPLHESRYAESPRRTPIDVEIASLRGEVAAILEDDHHYSPQKPQWRSPYGPFPQWQPQPLSPRTARTPPRSVLPDGRSLSLLSDDHPPAYRNSGRGGLPFPHYNPSASRTRTNTPVDSDLEPPVVAMWHPRVPVSSAGPRDYGGSSVSRYSAAGSLPTLPPVTIPSGGYPVAPEAPVTVTEYVTAPVTTYVMPHAALFGSPTPQTPLFGSPTPPIAPSEVKSLPGGGAPTSSSAKFSAALPATPPLGPQPAFPAAAYSISRLPAPQGTTTATPLPPQHPPMGPFNAVDYGANARAPPSRAQEESREALGSRPRSVSQSSAPSFPSDRHVILVDRIAKEYKPRSGHSAVIDAVEFPPEPRHLSPSRAASSGKTARSKQTPRPKRKTEIW